MEKYEFNDLSS